MRTDFIHFKDIDLLRPESWQGKKIVSLDVDWATDEVVNIGFELLKDAGVKATYFFTHASPLTKEILKDPLIESGIHPNFDPLINAENNAPSASSILDNLLTLIPGARVIRSHGMTHSGRWLPLYTKHGLSHSSQYFMNGMNSIQPFRHLNGMIEAPVYFADDGLIHEASERGWNSSVKRFSFKGIEGFLTVYNFHPIHIALNSSCYEDYNHYKTNKYGVEEMLALAKKRKGIKDLFIQLINAK